MPTPDEQPVIALYERWVKAGPPPLGVSLARWWDRRLVELRDAIVHRNDANNAEQSPRTTADNSPTSGDTTDNLRRLRTQLAAERDKARRGDEHPRPDLDHLRVTAHNGIAAGLEIALGYVDQQLREAGE